jgi:hypothetical protein
MTDFGFADYTVARPNEFGQMWYPHAVAACVPEALRELTDVTPGDETSLRAWAARWGFEDEWALRAAREHCARWRQIRRDEQGDARWLVLPATKTKTGEARVLPIGADLRAVLSLRQHAPDGTAHGPDAYVFGDDAGGLVSGIRRQWEDAVLLAHGHKPTRHRGKLTTESRAAFNAVDLHVHDLRRVRESVA